MTPPVRTPEQRTESLAEGVRMRQARAQVKADLKAGKIDLASVLDVGRRGAGDPIIGRLPVGQVIRAVPGIGNVKSARLLESLNVNAKTHIDDLPPGVRDAILAEIG